MKDAGSSFGRLVSAAMARRGLGLRELCRRAELDPSFFSKVLAGKRNPPSEEEPLRRLAKALELDPVELIVSAGRIPSEWSALWSDSDLVRAVSALAGGRRPPHRKPEHPPVTATPAPRPATVHRAHRGLSEELL